MTTDGDPVGIADALAAVRKELGLPPERAFVDLQARWHELVGPDVAAHAQLLALRDGVAIVAVDSPPWATQLRFLERELVARANAVAGEETLRAVTVRVRPEGAS